jgi:L-seryl-tRNA(Ser) seleniumtransferase
MLQRPVVIALTLMLSVTAFAAPANVVGRWNVSLELGSIVGHPTLDLKQDGEKLSGTYKGRYGAAPIEGAVKENEIGFTVTMNAEGQETSGYFSGTIDGDRMSGSVEFEGAGEGTWTATRAPAKKD